MGTADLTSQYKKALVTTISALFAADSTVKVAYGTPGKGNYTDVISVGDMQTELDFATMGNRRNREATMRARVQVWVYRGGSDGEGAEQAAGDRAYALLNTIEEYVRQDTSYGGDTTLGGVVRQCFCTKHDSDGMTDPADMARGRQILITAEFTALARVTS